MIDAGLPVKAFFSTRDGGVSLSPWESLNLAEHVGDKPAAVRANRATVAAQAGAPVVYMRPDHGIKVAWVGPEHAAGLEVPVADVLLTREPSVAIAALAADCVPLLMHDSLSGVVVAAHVGREGLFAGVVDAAMAALIDARGGWRSPESLAVSIGPAICGRCYEVPADLRARVASRHASAFASTRTGSPALDIPRAIESRLAELGLENIVRQRLCTAEDHRLFSHRRDGKTGRFAGVITLAPAAR